MAKNFVLNRTNVKKINVVKNGETTKLKKVVDKNGKVLWSAGGFSGFLMMPNDEDGNIVIKLLAEPDEDAKASNYKVYTHVWYKYNKSGESLSKEPSDETDKTADKPIEIKNEIPKTQIQTVDSISQEGYCYCTRARVSISERDSNDKEISEDIFELTPNLQLGQEVSNPPKATSEVYSGATLYGIPDSKYYSCSEGGLDVGGSYYTTCTLNGKNTFWEKGYHRGTARRGPFSITPGTFTSYKTAMWHDKETVTKEDKNGNKTTETVWTSYYRIRVYTNSEEATDTAHIRILSCSNSTFTNSTTSARLEDGSVLFELVAAGNISLPSSVRFRVSVDDNPYGKKNITTVEFPLKN